MRPSVPGLLIGARVSSHFLLVSFYFFLVETLFVFHQAELSPHRLAIISCIPECVPISEYRILLPELNPETNEIIPIEAYRPRDTGMDYKLSNFFLKIL